jgi:membrane peptidoglycan carboxypeptidase
MTSGTGTPGLPRDGVPIVGKTGTTDDAAQNWLVATTTKMSLAVWVGNTDGGRRSLRKITIAGSNGYYTKFNIFRNTMTSLNANPEYRGDAFPAPDPALVSGRGSAG